MNNYIWVRNPKFSFRLIYKKGKYNSTLVLSYSNFTGRRPNTRLALPSTICILLTRRAIGFPMIGPLPLSFYFLT